jgi:ribosomal protein S5
MVGGGISTITNVVAMVKGDKELDEAALCVVSDTGKSAAVGYGTGFVGSAMKGAMQNSPSSYLRVLSKTNLPANVVSVALETGKALQRLLSGQTTGSECLAELGQSGTGLLSSAMFASAFQVVIPIPVVGALIGSMVGYAFSSVFYGQLMSSINDAKLAREERIRIETECAAAIAAIREYRAEMERIIEEYLAEYTAVFNESFAQINEAYLKGDADGVISGANIISRKLGGNPQFETVEEFDTLMGSPIAFKI